MLKPREASCYKHFTWCLQANWLISQHFMTTQLKKIYLQCAPDCRSYLLPTWVQKITCQCFDWMLQSSSGWQWMNRHPKWPAFYGLGPQFPWQTQNVNVSEPHTRNVNVNEPHTRNVNVSEPRTRNVNVSEPRTRNVNVSEPHTRNVNVSEPHTRNINVSKPHTRNVNVSEPHTRNANVSELPILFWFHC